MARYKIDNRVVDTDKAEHWDEHKVWDGRNRISVNTGSQWEHEELYRTRNGDYYLECWSDWQGTLPTAKFVSLKQACYWLLANYYDESELPNDLQEFVDEILI